jgi:DNA-binding transcriptional regulator YhcF (GntR family)
LDDSRPVFQQIMDIVETDILTGAYQVGDLVISTTQISKVYDVNPTTAVKAIGKLADAGILDKKRGIGMCVATGAREKILRRRRGVFLSQTIAAVVAEAKTLGISQAELLSAITEREGGDGRD